MKTFIFVMLAFCASLICLFLAAAFIEPPVQTQPQTIAISAQPLISKE